MTNGLKPNQPLRIALLGDFKHDTLRNTQIIVRKLHKGLIRNGHDVMPFSFRNNMMELSPFSSKRLARKLAKKKTDLLCTQLLQNYQPHLIIVTTYRNLNVDTIDQIKSVLPDTPLLGWYGDRLDGITDESMRINRKLDFFLATGAGDHLKTIAQKINIPCGFMPNACDPDIERSYPASLDLQSNLFFTGKFSHKNCGTDKNRETILQTLIDRFGLKIHGAKGIPAVLGLDYFQRIANAKIALSVNATNDIEMYHSDRLINYMGCGTFVIAKYVPDSERLFEDKKHLRYFNDEQECIEFIEYYLAHEKERISIAQAGMAHAHQQFNCQRIARDFIDFAATGSYDEPWREIITP